MSIILHMCFARSSLFRTRVQELGLAGVMLHTHEPGAGHLEWKGVGGLFVLIICTSFILRNRESHRHGKISLTYF